MPGGRRGGAIAQETQAWSVIKPMGGNHPGLTLHVPGYCQSLQDIQGRTAKVASDELSFKSGFD
jgi:hypothetical protein